MKYLDKFTYWLINHPIFEMAYYRKDAVDKIRLLSGTIIEHIIKVKYIDDDYNKNHWRNEIISFFNRIDSITIKPNNRRFSRDEYLEFLFIEPYCDYTSSVNNIKLIDKYIIKIIRQINLNYNVEIEYSDIDFDEIILLFKDISSILENDDDFIGVIDRFINKPVEKRIEI